MNAIPRAILEIEEFEFLPLCPLVIEFTEKVLGVKLENIRILFGGNDSE